MTDTALNDRTEEILAMDEHLVHSFSDLHSLSAPDARTVITQAEGALCVRRPGKPVPGWHGRPVVCQCGAWPARNQPRSCRATRDTGFLFDIL